jgi:hypothetical protein
MRDLFRVDYRKMGCSARNSNSRGQEQQMIMNTCFNVSKKTFQSAEDCCGFLSVRRAGGQEGWWLLVKIHVAVFLYQHRWLVFGKCNNPDPNTDLLDFSFLSLPWIRIHNFELRIRIRILSI